MSPLSMKCLYLFELQPRCNGWKQRLHSFLRLLGKFVVCFIVEVMLMVLGHMLKDQHAPPVLQTDFGVLRIPFVEVSNCPLITKSFTHQVVKRL